MKQVLIPKQDLALKGSFNRARNESLKILSLTNDELKVYLQEQSNQIPYMNMAAMDIDSDAFLEYDYYKPSLHDEIMNQLHLMKESFDDEVCEYLLSQLDGNGYFKIHSKELIKQSSYSSYIIQHHIDLLHTIEPYGCFAFDLKDCLQIQCNQSEAAQSETALMLCDHLEDIALKRFDKIMKTCSISHDELLEGIHFIRQCSPKPAANYDNTTTFVNPEFKIEVIDHTINIQLLQDDLAIEFDTSDHANNQELSKFMKAQRAQVQSIISNIQKRNMTLLQIMQYICDVQKDYFLYHKPVVHLTLEMISKNCGLHISTISRAITNKSFEFEQHYVPLKKMLSSGGVDGVSSDVIKKYIVHFIEQEDAYHPLSDDAIRKLLAEEGITLSRRVIAKYRESCFIFNSSKRRLIP